MAQVRDITSESDFDSFLSSTPPGALITIFFHTPWAAPCKQMRTFFDALASQYDAASNKLSFLAIDAEELPEISENYDVTAVPFVVLTRDGKTLDSISGSNSARVRDAVEKEAGASAGGAKQPGKLAAASHAPQVNATEAGAETAGADGASQSGAKDLSGYTPGSADPKTGPEYSGGAMDEGQQQEDLNTRLAGLVKAAPVMLFMKGTPSSPQCGFSRQLVAILRERGVRYGFFNILADEDVRQGLKTFADWPTFPQLWVGGELVGGLDIVKEELENNDEFFAEYSVGQGQGGMAAPEQQKAPAIATA